VVDRTIRTILRVEIADFKRKMGEAAKVVDNNASSIDALSNHVGLLGTALTGFAALAVARFAAFDKQMSSVQAATRATGDELDSLRQAAIRAGADTAFSATEAAAGIEELAKAGVSTTDILNGGLTGALNLAAAGNLEVAAAAEIAASTLTQFELKGRDVGHIADVLAAGAGKAQGSVADMGLALSYAGVPAKGLGLSLEETAGSLALFAKNGIIGEKSGTALRGMLVSMTNPAVETKKVMDDLRISFFDANGEFIGMEGVSGVLQERLSGLTTETRNATLAQIFGNEALGAAQALYNAGPAGVEKWTKAVNDQGFAAEQARIQSDNLVGDLERLGGSFDAVLIQSGSGANDSLRMIVQAAEAAVDALGGIPAPALQGATAIAGAGGLALLGVAGLGKLAVSASEVKSALDAMNISVGTGAKAAGGLGVVLAGVGIGLAIMAQRAAESQGRVEQLAQTWTAAGEATVATNNLISESLTKQTDNMVDGNKTLIELADQVGVSTDDLIGYIEGEADAIDRVNSATDEYANQGGWIGAIAARSTESKNLRKELDDLSGEYVRSKEVSELDARAKDAGAEATQGATAATQEATGALIENSEALDENWQAQMDASGSILSLRDAQNAAEAAYDDATKALKDNGRTLDVTTEKGRANRSALDQIASSGFDVVDSIRSTGGSLKQVQGAMATARERFIATATSMGMSERAAARLADELKLIPKNVTTTATVNTGNALAEVATLDNTLNRIDGKVVTASVAIKQYGQAALATGGRLPGFPTGGRLPGTPPANPMQDNLLGVDGNGVPKVRVRSREWVINQPAADYYGDGLLSAINSRAISRDALASLPALAGGGAVGAAQAAVSYWWRQVHSARSDLRSARRTNSERAEQAAQNRYDRAQERLDVAQERRDRLRADASSLQTDISRGDFREQATSGMSGLYSLTDQARGLLNSGDLSRVQANRLRSTILDTEQAMRSLYSQAERAADRLDTLSQVSEDASRAVTGGFSLSDGMSDTPGTNALGDTVRQPASGRGLLASATSYAQRSRTLLDKIDALRARGFSGQILSEVASQGVEGGIAMADALLELSKAEAQALNNRYTSIGRLGTAVGQAVSEGYAPGGLAAAEANAAAIDKRIDQWAEKFAKSYAKALGIKARASGGSYNAGDVVLTGERGPELEIKGTSGYVVNAAQTRSALALGRGGVSSVQVSLSDGALARAMAGTALTLTVDGQPMRAVVEAVAGSVVSQHSAAEDRASRYARGI